MANNDYPNIDWLHKVPTLKEFENWPAKAVRRVAGEKTVVFSPGGSSRWYFLEYGEAAVGYDREDQFREYGRHAYRRGIELVRMMFDDGIRTVLLVALTPKQSRRNPEYNRNLRWGYSLLVDDDAEALYDQHQIGVLFRGGWKSAFEQLGSGHILEQCHRLERETASEREHWLIWVTTEDPIPPSLGPLITRTLTETGQMPDQPTLCRAYYGRQIEHADIFIGNNKPSVEGQLPPLMTVGDLYFTVAPTYYLDRRQWRHILYDHLFARRGHYRNYREMGEEVLDELRDYYEAHRSVTLGVGSHHASSQTWRPELPSPVDLSDSHGSQR